jgi:RNA polymerase sigma-70 factor (ECF subfamily)
MHTTHTDRELLGALSTDRAAFEAFYRRHVARVIRFAARRLREPADVADITAATFVEALASARRYDPARGEPVAWLLGIAARLIANGQRRQGREAAAMQRVAGRRLIETDDIERLEERIDASRATRTTLAAMARLKPRDQEALLLVGAEGLAPAQAAAVLGISGPAFRMRLRSARRALARALDQPHRLDPPPLLDSPLGLDAPQGSGAQPDPQRMNHSDLTEVTL